ncbi:CRAL-TRIO domain-containing protein [Dunaliella salina]|uniref:CRAL-TRIO domain-containing protein n=1 Tax=Dunaliella salina TaxID=3046 RepID=A0ABQ7GY97_DUNSA|nr:CRAL-TRIO domain-containing protein [Dunaliella salina]|eukprot:KAF5839566.1 CRAL-TRIO domain-containing protein [Dunaliella salina]
MPSAPPPVGGPLEFAGRIPYAIEDGKDDWGLTPQEQETYVEQFRRILEGKKAWREDQDYYLLRRFLRARSYDLEKATAMWMNNVAFKKEFNVDTILEDFVFEEREPFLEAYPQGYHKCDKLGRPVYIQLLGKVNVEAMKKVTNEQRMIKFHIQEYERCGRVILPVCSRLAGRNIDQTFGIMDVKGVGLSHFTGEVKRLLGLITKYDQDNYPEMLGHICVINAPWVFRTIWAVVKGYLDPRTQSKIEILDSNYLPAVLKWVDKESLPDWLGGSSHGTLIEDVGPWSDDKLVASLGLNLEDLRLGKVQTPDVRGRFKGDSEKPAKDLEVGVPESCLQQEMPKAPSLPPLPDGPAANVQGATKPSVPSADLLKQQPSESTNGSVSIGMREAKDVATPLVSSNLSSTARTPQKQPPPAAVHKPRSLLDRVAALEQACPQVRRLQGWDLKSAA